MNIFLKLCWNVGNSENNKQSNRHVASPNLYCNSRIPNKTLTLHNHYHITNYKKNLIVEQNGGELVSYMYEP